MTLIQEDLDDVPTTEVAIGLADEVVAAMVKKGYVDREIRTNLMVAVGVAEATIRSYRAGYTAALTAGRRVQ